MLLLEEYLSFPTSTLHVLNDADKIPLPAFTICPKPSVKASLIKKSNYSGSKYLNFNQFLNASVSLTEVVRRAPFSAARVKNHSTSNGETTMSLLKSIEFR